ncbi:MAG TPA: response regulator [Chloroflexota bacterium]|nr:response regulator [Chloroflexota bacterium]
MTLDDGGRAIEILLVEDNPGDVRLTVEALADGKICNSLHFVKDGLEALAFLRREGAYTAAPRPDLILLDLNLPGKDGRDVLAEIRQDAALRDIPVIILTASRADRDLLRSYALQADGYMTKPIDLPQLIALVHAFQDFWMTVVRTPRAAFDTRGGLDATLASNR